MAGLLTRTVIRSPVIRWILQARIRRKDYNDVAFVGDDFVHIKEVGEFGHLDHIAKKCNFDTRIRAATVFPYEPSEDTDDIFLKLENGGSRPRSPQSPPQCLVLAFESSELIFVWLREDDQGNYGFVHQTCPLPRFDRMLFQLGEHLAVDPHSHALAVAASEREIMIFATRPQADIKSSQHQDDGNWKPIFEQRPLQVDGVIRQMAFLRPSAEDDDHVILLLIVADSRRTKAVWIDWYADGDIHQAQIHTGQLLAMGPAIPALLIPLRNGAFLLITGATVILWTDLLSGSAVSKSVPLAQIDPAYPGASPQNPMWVNWCRPRRVQANDDGFDHIYLVREDGHVLLLQASSRQVISCHAGDFECHVGNAFASLGGIRDPDILIAAGETSSGRIFSIGHWATPIRVPDMERSETMQMQLVETLPNWASVTDMVTSTLPGKSYRARDGLFVTSGRQPYGAVTELRRGVEARQLAYFELEGSRAVTDVWALPLSVGRVLIILSTPSETRLLDVSAVVDSVEELGGDDLALDDGSQTLTAAATQQCKLIQVTRRSICVSPGLYPNFEDAARMNCEETTIIAAAIDTIQWLVVTAERSNFAPSAFKLASYVFASDDEHAMDTSHIEAKSDQSLGEEPLCVNLLTRNGGTFVLVATSGGKILAFQLQEDKTFTPLSIKTIADLGADPSICDSMAVLSCDPNDDRTQTGRLLVCGLRDGRLCIVRMDMVESFTFGEERFIDLGRSNVKLTQPLESSVQAYATSGLDTCLLTCEDQDSLSLRIENIWISDKQRPELSQGAVTACTHMPSAHLLSTPNLADSLILLSGDEFSVTTLDRTVGPVPRQIPVSGTPNRLLYAEQQRCLVCSSLRYDVQYFPSSIPHAKPEERRQIWPVIDFIPSRASEPSFSYDMQPGERVHALLEWSFRLAEDKTYSFILIAGSYTRSSGSLRGRITFLQPINKNWTVLGVKEGRKTNFDAPVYALALLDEYTYVACVGSSVVVSRFAVNERKWQQICAPLRLSSPGVYVTTDAPAIQISTAEDSFVVLDLRPNDSNEDLDTNIDQRHPYRLVCRATAPRADALISHVMLSPSSTSLATTKYGKILGFSYGTEGSIAQSSVVEIEACLPRSLTRTRQCNICPPWKQGPESLKTEHELIGCATDGSLIGIRVLDEDLLRRLSWLQRLCEWSEELSPHSHQHPPYAIDEQTYAKNERAMPVGFSAETRDRGELVMRTSRSRMRDRHVDGDVLARFLENGAAEALKKILTEAAGRGDRVGDWVRGHLEMEMKAVDEVVEIVKCLLDGWL